MCPASDELRAHMENHHWRSGSILLARGAGRARSILGPARPGTGGQRQGGVVRGGGGLAAIYRRRRGTRPRPSRDPGACTQTGLGGDRRGAADPASSPAGTEHRAPPSPGCWIGSHGPGATCGLWAREGGSQARNPAAPPSGLTCLRGPHRKWWDWARGPAWGGAQPWRTLASKLARAIRSGGRCAG